MRKFTSRIVSGEPSLTILHNGGGTQSGTLIEMIHDGIIERPDAVLQADTGDEPAYIYRQWQRDKSLMDGIGVPYIIVRNGNMHDDLYGGKRFAAMPLFTINETAVSGFGVSAKIQKRGKLRRQCTAEYKIVPIEREIRIMLLEMGLAREYKNGAIHIKKDILVESWLGYTMDELQRVKKGKLKWQYFRYPLIEMRMTKQDCIKWLADNGKPPRLSSFCIKCPLVGDVQLRQLRDNDSDGWENRLQFDDDLRNENLRIAATANGELFIHPSMIPMREVDIETSDYGAEFLCANVGCMT